MKGILVFAFLFLAGAVLNLVEHDYANVLSGLVLSGLLFAIYLFFRWQSKKSDEFTGWLFYNKDKILREGANYGEAFVNGSTVITQFHVCLSLIIFTTKIPTRFYIKDYDNSIIVSLLC